jgi:hypothetical protein
MDKSENKGLLTVKEMCAYMSIGQNTARKLLNRPYNSFTVRIGNRLYANKKLLDKWIDQNSGI